MIGWYCRRFGIKLRWHESAYGGREGAALELMLGGLFEDWLLLQPISELRWLAKEVAGKEGRERRTRPEPTEPPEIDMTDVYRSIPGSMRPQFEGYFDAADDYLLVLSEMEEKLSTGDLSENEELQRKAAWAAKRYMNELAEVKRQKIVNRDRLRSRIRSDAGRALFRRIEERGRELRREGAEFKRHHPANREQEDVIRQIERRAWEMRQHVSIYGPTAWVMKGRQVDVNCVPAAAGEEFMGQFQVALQPMLDEVDRLAQETTQIESEWIRTLCGEREQTSFWSEFRSRWGLRPRRREK